MSDGRMIKDIPLSELKEERQMVLKEMNALQMELHTLQNALDQIDIKLSMKRSHLKFAKDENDSN